MKTTNEWWSICAMFIIARAFSLNRLNKQAQNTVQRSHIVDKTRVLRLHFRRDSLPKVFGEQANDNCDSNSHHNPVAKENWNPTMIFKKKKKLTAFGVYPGPKVSMRVLCLKKKMCPWFFQLRDPRYRLRKKTVVKPKSHVVSFYIPNLDNKIHISIPNKVEIHDSLQYTFVEMKCE